MRLCWGRWKRPEGAPLRSPPFAHLAAGPHLGRGIGGGREGPGGTGGSENIRSSGRGSGGANSGATAAAESTPLLGTQSEELRGGVCWRGRLRDTLVYPGTAQSVPKVLLATPFPPPEDSQDPHRHPGPPQPLPELHTWPEAAADPRHHPVPRAPLCCPLLDKGRHRTTSGAPLLRAVVRMREAVWRT